MFLTRHGRTYRRKTTSRRAIHPACAITTRSNGLHEAQRARALWDSAFRDTATFEEGDFRQLTQFWHEMVSRPHGKEKHYIGRRDKAALGIGGCGRVSLHAGRRERRVSRRLLLSARISSACRLHPARPFQSCAEQSILVAQARTISRMDRGHRAKSTGLPETGPSAES